jgi:PEP-CTERM motif
MARAFPRVAVWLAVLLLFSAGAAMADTANLTFVDGNTVSGTFAYDVTQNKIVSWNFVSTEFNGTTFDSSSVNSQCFGFPCGGLALTNQNGDVVFGFDAAQPNANNALDEFDIVISCGGVANCVQNILSQAGNGVGNSFALTTGQPACNPNAPNFCIASGEQQNLFNCLGASCQVLLGGNNFLTITDPPSPGDVVVNMTLSSAPVGTVLSGNGGTTGVPEPSTLLLSGLGLGALALKRFYA